MDLPTIWQGEHTTPTQTLGAAFAFLMTVLWPRRFFFDDAKSKEF
jgi:hypothetical protein